MVTRLAITVSTIDSATLPPARKVKTFEVVPPGQAAMITRPTAIAGDGPSSSTRPKASSGISAICAAVPTSMARGKVKTRRKSVTVSVRPMPAMMIIRAMGSPVSISGLSIMDIPCPVESPGAPRSAVPWARAAPAQARQITRARAAGQ